MKEQRRQIRKDVASQLPVVDVNTGHVIGELANISSEGFMVYAKREFAPHSVFQLSMALPKPVRGVDSLYFGAESLWSSPADGGGNFWVGFHLIDISPQDLEVLQYFVESV